MAGRSWLPVSELDDQSWELVHSAVARFEAAWQSGSDPSPAQFLPSPEDPLHCVVLVEIIKVDQERRWRTGRPKRLEDYLEEWPDLRARAEIVRELLEAECLTRSVLGSPVTCEELRLRFSGLLADADLAAIAAAVSGRRTGHDTSSGTPVIEDTVAPGPAQPDAPGQLKTGDRLGRYEIRAELGRGGMATVYLADDLELQRRVAIKVPRADRFQGDEDVSRFIDEARTAAKLKHPSLVPIYDLVRVDGGTCFVVMEYIDGPSLKDMLAQERLGHVRAVEILIAVAEAVHYLHTRGFVHRDLKPGNVLLDREGRPHVADFGLAVHESTQRQRGGEHAGTLPYMAPEQVRGEAHRLDGRADIWALGVLLYEMLTGRTPFGGARWDELSDEILNRQPKPPRQIDDTIPEGLERICLRCLSKDLTDRYATAADLARDLRRWQRSGKSPAAKWLSAAALLATGLGAIVAWRVWRPDGEQNPPGGSEVIVDKVLRGEIDVMVWSPDPSRRWLRLRDPGAVPLRAGDYVRVEARLNRPTYVYLVWIDSQGAATPLYPWGNGKWSDRPEEELPVDQLALPEASEKGWPMEVPASGTETLLLLGRDSPLPATIDLPSAFAQLRRQPALSVVAWFQDGRLVDSWDGPLRAPRIEAVPIPDPLLENQRAIVQKLSPFFTFIRTVNIPGRGK